MKKLIWVVTITGFCILACKKKDETPTPVKKYEYKRTPGEVTKIEGDVFVDTGGTVFTVKGKGFDPMKKNDYHLYLSNGGCNAGEMIIRPSSISFLGTSEVLRITDSTIEFKTNQKNLFNTRTPVSCTYIDSIQLYFAVSSRDSTNKANIVLNYDKLSYKKVRNELVYHILSDTLYWHKNSSNLDKTITLDDVWAGGTSDHIELYFNNNKLNTSNSSPYCFLQFTSTEPTVGDGYFMFNKDFYDSNKSLGLTNGFYNITMKERKTGMSLLERHGKKGVYVKFVN